MCIIPSGGCAVVASLFPLAQEVTFREPDIIKRNTMREELGIKRVVYSCRKCSVWCEAQPGFLVPSDLHRLIPQGVDPFVWAEEHLRASPGLRVVTSTGVLSIPSLVPKKQESGHCHWLKEGRCAVHENSPFGCAFLSQCSQSDAEAERILTAGRQARAEAFRTNDLYARIWTHLWDKSLRYTTGREDRQHALLRIQRIDRHAEMKERRKAKKARRKRRSR